MRGFSIGGGIAALSVLLAVAVYSRTATASHPTSDPPPPHLPGRAAKIVAAARAQVGEGAVYTVGYFHIGYPNGDLPRSQGVCTDVVIRALRGAGYDLQKLIHEDISRHFESYPRREAHPDSNIDHRRVPNQIHFFKRFGTALTKSVDASHRSEWRPGDLVYWKLPSGLDHAGVLSDRLGASGLPMVIHNLAVCREEDVLGAWTIQGHFRFPRTHNQS